MRKQRDGIFRCRMASTGTIVTGVILCGVCLLVLIILSEELGFNVITGILVSPIIAYIIILATNIILESTTFLQLCQIESFCRDLVRKLHKLWRAILRNPELLLDLITEADSCILQPKSLSRCQKKAKQR